MARDRLRRLADEELVELAARNDADAFEVMLERHSGVMFSLAYRMCGTRALAEDVAQDSFLALWRNSAAYDRARGSVRTWALGVTHNRAVDTLRRMDVHERRRTRAENVEEHLQAPESTDGEAIANVASEEFRGILAELPSEQRRVIELAYFGGFTQTEIASMLDTPLGTIKGRMRLGLEKLKVALAAGRSVHELA